MRKMIGTIVEGAVGILALYVVGHITFAAGKELGEAEQKYAALQEKINQEKINQENSNGVEIATIPEKKTLIGTGVKSLIFRNIPIVGKMLDKPEDHKIEAFVENGGIHIDVKGKNAK